jgi:hypothetical protein
MVTRFQDPHDLPPEFFGRFMVHAHGVERSISALGYAW